MIQKDQHDSIDFTDNSITILGNLPLLRRLRTLHLGNNRIMSISPNLHLSCPGLNTLILTSNNVGQLGDLEPLKEFRFLQYLSLLGNPVRERKYYREWIIFRVKSLRVLDFQRIREKVCIPFFACPKKASHRVPLTGKTSCEKLIPYSRLAGNRSVNTAGNDRYNKRRQSGSSYNSRRATCWCFLVYSWKSW